MESIYAPRNPRSEMSPRRLDPSIKLSKHLPMPLMGPAERPGDLKSQVNGMHQFLNESRRPELRSQNDPCTARLNRYAVAKLNGFYHQDVAAEFVEDAFGSVADKQFL